MSLTLAGIVVVLPFASAGLLACIGSWRTGVRINAASSSLLFVLACLLPAHFASALAAHLAVLTSFVAMTTSWFGWRDVRAALGTRRLDRYRTRLHHVAVQVLVGAMLLAIVSDSPALTWLGTAIAVAAAAALTGTVRTLTAQRATGRLLQLCGVALMLALFGTLLLHLAAAPEQASLQWSAGRFHLAPPDLAMLCLVLGYGGIAGLAPLHSWLPDAAAESTAPGAILITALLANVPLLAMLRVRCAIADGPDAPVALLVVLGLATLLVAGFCLLARRDTRRSLAFAGSAQTGIVVFAFGLGGRTATLAGLLLMTLTTLAKAAALQCAGPAADTGRRAYAHGGSPGSRWTADLRPVPCCRQHRGLLSLAAVAPWGRRVADCRFAGGRSPPRTDYRSSPQRSRKPAGAGARLAAAGGGFTPGRGHPKPGG